MNLSKTSLSLLLMRLSETDPVLPTFLQHVSQDCQRQKAGLSYHRYVTAPWRKGSLYKSFLLTFSYTSILFNCSRVFIIYLPIALLFTTSGQLSSMSITFSKDIASVLSLPT